MGVKLLNKSVKNNRAVINILGIKIKLRHKPKSLLQENYSLKEVCSLMSNFSNRFNYDDVIDYNTNNYDENIKSALSELGKFYFLPNRGNMGDMVIAFSEFQYFESNGLDYEVYDFEKPQTKFNFVYGGGGIWYNLYKEGYQDILDIFRSPNLEKCVILPSSFNDCDDVLELLDKRFTVFCKEKNSYDYCCRKNKRAKFILADDMVINADFDCFKKNLFDKKVFLENIDSKKLDVEKSYKQYFSAYERAYECLDYCKRNKIGYLLREDKEGVLEDFNIESIDPSGFAGGYACDSGLNTLLTNLFLYVINKFDIVVTDRLHVGICAAKLGKRTLLLDNSYKKLSRAYKQSLKTFPNVVLSDIDNYKSDLEKLKQGPDSSKFELKNDINMTIADYFVMYNSIKNKYGTEKTFWN